MPAFTVALYYAVLYMIDRAVMPRLGWGLNSTFVFPAAMTALMFLFSLVSPIDGTPAKNVLATAPTPLPDLYALTGQWVFVLRWSWLAACVNHAWERSFGLRPSAISETGFTVVAAALMVWGALRIANAPEVPTVRIAAAVMPAVAGGIGSMTDVFERRQTSPYEPTMTALASMVNEAAAGSAKFVAFSEFAIVFAESDHAAARAAIRASPLSTASGSLCPTCGYLLPARARTATC